MPPIALYDSGLGGLTVFRALAARMPREALLYFGDTARVPYGPRPPEEILAFSEEIVGLLLAAGAKAIVVACNTSSAIALPALRIRVPVPMFGLIDAGAAAAVAAAPNGPIAVIATEATVRNGAYGRAIAERAPQAAVTELACPALVPLVESGTWSGRTARETVASALAPLRTSPPEALVLGCTHYPHLAAAIAEVLPDTTLVDPARGLAEAVERELGAEEALCLDEQPPTHRLWVSGDPEAFAIRAARLMPGLVASVERVGVAQTVR